MPSLLQPGSWFADRAKRSITFMPTAADTALGMDKAQASVLAAVGIDAASTALLDLDGVTGTSFEGVHFTEGGGWGGASNALGYTETQAAYHASSANFDGYNDSLWVAVPAAINVHGGSRDVSFTGCNFTRMGASAIMFSGGSQGGSVLASSFSDLSGSAVMLGQVNDWAQADPAQQNGGFVLARNTIERTSLEYRGSPAITAGYVRDTVIESNEIAHLSCEMPRLSRFAMRARASLTWTVPCCRLRSEPGMGMGTGRFLRAEQQRAVQPHSPPHVRPAVRWRRRLHRASPLLLLRSSRQRS